MLATSISRSHSDGFLFIVGEMKRIVYETPLDTKEELVACVAAAVCSLKLLAFLNVPITGT